MIIERVPLLCNQALTSRKNKAVKNMGLSKVIITIDRHEEGTRMEVYMEHVFKTYIGYSSNNSKNQKMEMTQLGL